MVELYMTTKFRKNRKYTLY